MTLTIARDADGVPGRVCKIVKVLGLGDIAAGVAVAADLTGKSPSTIRAWMSETRGGAEPGFSAGVILDRAYFQATGAEPPLMRWYEDQMSLATGGAHGTAKLNLWRELVNAQVAAAEVPRQVRDSTHPDGPGGAAITRGELAQISQASDAAKDSLDRVTLAARQVFLTGRPVE